MGKGGLKLQRPKSSRILTQLRLSRPWAPLKKFPFFLPRDGMLYFGVRIIFDDMIPKSKPEFPSTQDIYPLLEGFALLNPIGFCQYANRSSLRFHFSNEIKRGGIRWIICHRYGKNVDTTLILNIFFYEVLHQIDKVLVFCLQLRLNRWTYDRPRKKMAYHFRNVDHAWEIIEG